jgi:2-polyprenyl-3-methyl-5-hydroxy-6-metoxy-1,4-benzoquinol methylase
MIFYRILLHNYDKFQRIYWDSKAEDIYEKWGKSSHDWKVLSLLIDRYKPSSILDVGCGSGRLFGLYQQKHINDVIGIDVSEKALKLANRDFPTVKTMRMKTEDMNFGYKQFDLAICNRTLQHIPKQNIDTVIKKLCSSSWMVYINELTSSDGISESKDMFKHDYLSILGKNGFRLCEEGNIGRQTWLLFSKKRERMNDDK